MKKKEKIKKDYARITICMSPELAAKIRVAAAQKGVSMSYWISYILNKVVEQ